MNLSGHMMTLSDTARGWRLPTALLRRYHLAKASSNGRTDDQQRAHDLVHLCTAARLSNTDREMLIVEQHITHLIEHLNPNNINWVEFDPRIHDRQIERAVILKPWISDSERGVLYVSLCDQWSHLMVDCDVTKLASRYKLVIAPGWSPPHDFMNYMLPKVYPGNIYCLISNLKDLKILPRLSHQYRPVKLFASSWSDPQRHQPLDYSERDIDLIMVASFARYKRPFLLFKALRRMPKDLRVLLIGAETELTAKQIWALAREYRVEDRVEIRVSVPNDEVASCLSRARASVILSRREGSCVAVAESLFAGTPVGIMEDAHIGSAAFINDQTGMFLRSQYLADDITALIRKAESFTPRLWAEGNITCHQSTSILNNQLRQDALALGEDWSTDIAVHHRCPCPRLLYPKDQQRMAKSYDEFYKRFGIKLISTSSYNA